MPSYPAFLHSGIESPSEDTFNDGIQLIRNCVSQLDEFEDREQFPPRLLILLTSPAYLDQRKAQLLLDGIHQAFSDKDYPDVPLSPVRWRTYQRGAKSE